MSITLVAAWREKQRVTWIVKFLLRRVAQPCVLVVLAYVFPKMAIFYAICGLYDVSRMDLFVVPTISFRLLYGFLILQHSRRELLWLGVTARPSAHWIARQLTEAYGWQQAPQYIVRDRDCVKATRAFRLAGDRIAIGARGSLGASSNERAGEISSF